MFRNLLDWQTGDLVAESLVGIKLWMWNLATAPVWSYLICVISRRNEFLHSFCNFSKNNPFDKNFIRTKFILHEIFFRMSILSSRETSWMFFNLCWKNCEKLFVGGHDHFQGKRCLATKINVDFFVRNEVLNILHITVFCLSFTQYGGFWKNFKTIFGTLFPIKKVIFIFVDTHPLHSKWSWLLTNGFSQFFQHKLKNTC